MSAYVDMGLKMSKERQHGCVLNCVWSAMDGDHRPMQGSHQNSFERRDVCRCCGEEEEHFGGYSSRSSAVSVLMGECWTPMNDCHQSTSRCLPEFATVKMSTNLKTHDRRRSINISVLQVNLEHSFRVLHGEEWLVGMHGAKIGKEVSF